MKCSSIIACGLAIASAVATQAYAQGYPTKPIRMVVPYPPGGGADTLARMVAAKMSEKLGQQVIIESKPGANTIIATDYVARQPADGYTLLYVASSFTINPSFYKLNHSPEKDFSPVSMVALVPLIILANNDYPVKSVSDIVDAAKAAPGAISYASYGLGSPAHLAGALLESMTGTRMLHVPYKGSAPALKDLIGGQVKLDVSSIGPAVTLMASKSVRPIAVTTAKRVAAAPDVPTVAETVPGFEAAGWNGIVAVAGTPPEIVNRLNKVINEVVSAPEMERDLVKQGMEVDLKTPEEFSRMIKDEIAKWGELIKNANLKIE